MADMSSAIDGALVTVKENPFVCFVHGLMDGVNIVPPLLCIWRNRGQRKLIEPIVMCFLLNGCIFLGSILFFDRILNSFAMSCVVLIHTSSYNTIVWAESLLAILWNLFFVYPLYILSKFFLSPDYFDSIAQATSLYYTARRNPHAFENTPSPLVLKKRPLRQSDTIKTVVMESILVLMALSSKFIPTYGMLIMFFYNAQIHALYSFEYKWSNSKINLKKRTEFMEKNWIYFFGFGLPFAIVSYPLGLLYR